MLLVIGHLNLAAAARFGNRFVHGIGNFVGIHNHMAMIVSRSAADCLNKAAIVTQKALFIGIENGHKRHFGQVEALAQQVDAHKHVEFATAQIAQNLDALERCDVGMHIASTNPLIKQMIGKIFRHFLRERGNEHALVGTSALASFVDNVVDLARNGPHIDIGIEQPRRTNNLLDLLLADLFLVIARRGRHVNELGHALLEFVEAQRAIVEAARQTETMLGERDFSTAVAFVHATNLRHRDMALVDDAEEIFREIVEERICGLAWRTAVKVPRVILDAAAKTHGFEHFQIVIHAHFQTLSLEQLAFGFELRQSIAQLVLNGLNGSVHLRARGNVMRRRPNGQRLEFVELLARHVVDFLDALDFIAPEFHAHRIVGIRRKHIERVAAHAKGSALEFIIVAVVLDIDELMNHIVALGWLFLIEKHRHARIVHRRADAVNAADRRHHDYIAARKQARCRSMAQLLDLFVNRCVFLNEGVGRRHVRLRLVVVVIRNEIDHRIIGEEFLELGRKLGRERFIRRHDERGLLSCLNDFRHGECFARARDAQKVLVAQAALYPIGKLLDSLGLIA